MNKGQRTLLFFVFFFGTLGILHVDLAYGDLLDREPQLRLSLRRMDEENIKVTLLGKTEEINLEEARTKWDEMEIWVAAAFDGAIASTKEFLGLQEGTEHQEEPLHTVDLPLRTL